MARKSKATIEREKQDAEELAEYQRTYQTRLFRIMELIPQTLYYDVRVKEGFLVVENHEDLPYNIPEDRYDEWKLQNIEDDIEDAVQKKAKDEQDRKAREKVLAKLSDEEKRVLGFK